MTVAITMQSCFTGIEGTSKISLSKKDLTIIAPTEEEIFMSALAPPAIKEWGKGRRFLVTDDKFRYVIEGSMRNPVVKDDTLTFLEIEKRYSAGGGESSILKFLHKDNIVAYPLEKKVEDAKNEITSAQLPMLIDLEVVRAVGEKLEGKKLWTKTLMWYDDSLQYIKGKKYTEVTVNNVTTGNTFFPLLIQFVGKDKQTGYYLMNFGNSGNESRSFSKLFSLTDPRNNYRQIKDENWEAIQKEEVRPGMTKEECRLSKGNPEDLDSGHSYSSTMEIWKYSDGTILRFVDGLLISQ